MRLTILAALAATSALACTETPEDVGTTPMASVICLGDTLAAAPLTTPGSYTVNTVLPQSTSGQTWLLLPWAHHYDTKNNLIVDSWGLFQIDNDLKKVQWGAIVPPALFNHASSAIVARLGNRGTLGRPPTPPGWPAGTNWTLADQLVTISTRLSQISTGL